MSTVPWSAWEIFKYYSLRTYRFTCKCHVQRTDMRKLTSEFKNGAREGGRQFVSLRHATGSRISQLTPETGWMDSEYAIQYTETNAAVHDKHNWRCSRYYVIITEQSQHGSDPSLTMICARDTQAAAATQNRVYTTQQSSFRCIQRRLNRAHFQTRKWTSMPQRKRGCLRHHMLKPAVTLTFNLWLTKSNQVISRC